MKTNFRLVFGLATVLILSMGVGCPLKKTAEVDTAQSPWEKSLDKTITVEGGARNAMMGAFVVTSNGEIWVEGLDAWPADRDARKIRVTGTVIRRADLPVYVEKPGEPERQGIPVPEGTDLTAAATRYLLTNATWELVE